MLSSNGNVMISGGEGRKGVKRCRVAQVGVEFSSLQQRRKRTDNFRVCRKSSDCHRPWPRPRGRDHAPGSACLPPWSPAPGAGPRPLRRGPAPSTLLFGARALLHCFGIILHWEADSKGYLRLRRFLAPGHTSKCLLIFAVLFRMCF